MDIVIVLLVVGAIIFFLFGLGPVKSVRRIDDLSLVTDDALFRELLRAKGWLADYMRISKSYQNKIAQDGVAVDCERYIAEMENEMQRRIFFKKLMEYFPQFNLMLPAAYGMLINDPIFNLAWDMYCKEKDIEKVVEWFASQIG